MLRRPAIVVIALLALLSGACSSEESPSGDETPDSSTGPQTRTVLVDFKPAEFNGHALTYFPASVTVRPGDTVNFKENFTGEPHSVTMGTLIDEVIPQAVKLGPTEAPSAELQEKLDALPLMLPEGPGDANQAAVNPCYLDSGAPPTDAAQACPKVDQPAFNGKQTYYNSGFLSAGQEFEVDIAEDTAPGTYAYYCNLHGATMAGVVVVDNEGATIPSQADVDKAAEAEIDKYFESTRAAYADIKAGKPAAIPGNLAGYGVDGSTAGINEFLPATIDAKVGEKVSWTVLGPHTITFNPPPAAQAQGGFLSADPAGKLHLNPLYFAPEGGAGQPAPSGSTPPASGPPVPVEIKGGSFDGTGFRSSGLILSFPVPGSFFSYSLTFTKAGSYPYVCTIHPGMNGTVKVA